ncbi:MAG: hypothetical protein M3P27_04740 [Acidobacteriota bacterium]|nr:hypothetical protein [Acidobacteriota bacterium]
MKRLLAIVFLFIAAAGFAAEPQSTPAPLLPQAFSEWQKTAPKVSIDPAQADAANADVLKEYRFTGFEAATYTKAGRTLKLKAARFRDKSGAYGAFTFYKDADMITQQIGDQGSANGEHVLFYKGNVLVDAQFDRINAMSAAELRELAEALPKAEAAAQIPPPLPSYFPKQSYVKNSVRYVLGPAGLSAIRAPVTADVVEFSKAPEIALAKYTTSTGEATLTLIEYPTPQIAAQRLRSIEGALNSDPDKRNERNNYAAKRTGPIVVIVTGAIPDGEAKSLLASINYEAEVTWNERTKFTLRDSPANLVWAAMRLAGYLVLSMFGLGIVYAVFRFWARRYWPEREHSRDMIRLDLRSREPDAVSQALPPGPAK